MKILKRTFRAKSLQTDSGRITGYAAVFNSESEDLGGYTEIIRPGAFTEALEKSDIRALFNHDPNLVLGRVSAGTLIVKEDTKGLWIDILLPEASWAQDLRESVKRGDISQMSFSFIIDEKRWINGNVQEILKFKEILDISVVTYPAYPETNVSARDIRNRKENIPMKTIEYLRNKINKLEAERVNMRKLPDNEFLQSRERSTEIERELEELKPLLDSAWEERQRDLSGDHQENNNRASVEVIGSEYRNNRGSSSSGPFKTLGEQMRSIVSAGSPGGQTDPKLFEVRSASGLNETVGSEGGFLLQDTFAKDIIKNAWDSAHLLNLCQKFSIETNAIKIPAEDETSRVDGSRHGGVQAYWIAEAGEKLKSKPKFRQLALSLKKCVVLVYTTDELLEDATALNSYLKKVAPEEIGFKVQDSIVNGSGAGQPLGFLNSGALVTVPKEAGQATNTVNLSNLVNMWTRMPARNRKNAVWLINQDIEPQLFQLTIAVGTGGSAVFLPGGNVAGSPYASLFGRPIIPTEQCATLGTVGDICLVDPQSYILADRGGIQSDVSIHVRFVYDESVFRFVYRVDGQPSIASPITPKNGTNTLSPFVALATRA